MCIKILYYDRGTGKTTKCIKLSARTGYPIVTVSRAMSIFIEDKAKKIGKTIVPPIPIHEWETRCRGQHYEGVIIDELDSVLSDIFKINSKRLIATLSKRDCFGGRTYNKIVKLNWFKRIRVWYNQRRRKQWNLK